MAGKLGLLAALALVGAFFVTRGGSADASGAARCLREAGATVNEIQLSERGLAGGKGYDVQLGYNSGVLMAVNGQSAEGMERGLDQSAGAAQRSGRIIMYWFQPPSASSAATADRCLG